MQLHELKRNHPNKKERNVGRGGKRGKTSGRGTKGQKARSGHKIRPEIRDRIKKMPKRRGHGKNRARTVVATRTRATAVALQAISKVFNSGARVTPDLLIERGIVKTIKGKMPDIKIVGEGALEKKLHVMGCVVSAGALAAITKAGGTVAKYK